MNTYERYANAYTHHDHVYVCWPPEHLFSYDHSKSVFPLTSMPNRILWCRIRVHTPASGPVLMISMASFLFREFGHIQESVYRLVFVLAFMFAGRCHDIWLACFRVPLLRAQHIFCTSSSSEHADIDTVCIWASSMFHRGCESRIDVEAYNRQLAEQRRSLRNLPSGKVTSMLPSGEDNILHQPSNRRVRIMQFPCFSMSVHRGKDSLPHPVCLLWSSIQRIQQGLFRVILLTGFRMCCLQFPFLFWTVLVHSMWWKDVTNYQRRVPAPPFSPCHLKPFLKTEKRWQRQSPSSSTIELVSVLHCVGGLVPNILSLPSAANHLHSVTRTHAYL